MSAHRTEMVSGLALGALAGAISAALWLASGDLHDCHEYGRPGCNKVQPEAPVFQPVPLYPAPRPIECAFDSWTDERSGNGIVSTPRIAPDASDNRCPYPHMAQASTRGAEGLA